MKRLIPIFIILFWITTTFLLIHRYTPNTELDIKSQSLHAGTALLQADKKRWMGIYLKGKKIGFVSSRFHEEIDGYAVHEEIKMRFMILGTLQDIHSTTNVSLSPDFKIRSFRFTMDKAQDIKIKGVIQNKILILDIETAGNKSRQEIQLNETPQIPLTVIPYLLRKGIKSGMRARFPVFDPTTLSTKNMLVDVVGKEKILLNNNEVDAFKIRGDLNGIPLMMWIDEQGDVLKEEGLMGFTLVAEPMAEAMKLLVSSSEISDLITQTVIPFNIKLPHDISYLKVRLRGIDFEGLELSGGRQTIKGDILEIMKEDINVSSKGVSERYLSLPIYGLKIQQFLKDSPFIQSKNPRIVNLANEITRGEKDPLSAGRLLWAWVFKNIEKTPSITIPSAIDVLNTRKGDCNEHTALYTALARSIGLPTRISVGLVYKDSHFYYHAWPEIFVGRWIAIDPTLG